VIVSRLAPFAKSAW
jgi:hypothetical protein